ncbi:nuclear speckle RNA-binding protein A-like isoform X1 [Nymphaea colorata]|nr:nuclear speckle RNA-binding protein A-like isoform X1 [Nymphaea colorata]
MADGYWRYAAQRDNFQPPGRELDAAGVSANFPGYSTSENSSFAGQHLWRAGDLPLSSSDFGHNNIPSLKSTPHHFDAMGIGDLPRSGVGGVDAGTSLAGLSNSFDDQFLLNRRRDLLGIDSAVPPVLSERAHSLAKSDVLSECTNILFVEGLPSDCTRREVSHLFRPFIGFKEIRVIHKECRRLGEKAFVICFVEFKDEKCAATALEALQGYRFDDKKPDSPVLRIQFARFPFRPHDRLQNNAL